MVMMAMMMVVMVTIAVIIAIVVIMIAVVIVIVAAAAGNSGQLLLVQFDIVSVLDGLAVAVVGAEKFHEWIPFFLVVFFSLVLLLVFLICLFTTYVVRSSLGGLDVFLLCA
ncbi:hypothetical protein KDK_49230 [Dictyobacter kobayashii]|uniref:Uncharacterized protein n=1 Tax=Dictyobacter kobayashii TaxID=2014872 RepID=A0A402APN1_9CHLR|nr:hypothetical protein KDK_49230 [Dictyobacter kobayashii]